MRICVHFAQVEIPVGLDIYATSKIWPRPRLITGKTQSPWSEVVLIVDLCVINTTIYVVNWWCSRRNLWLKWYNAINITWRRPNYNKKLSYRKETARQLRACLYVRLTEWLIMQLTKDPLPCKVVDFTHYTQVWRHFSEKSLWISRNNLYCQARILDNIFAANSMSMFLRLHALGLENMMHIVLCIMQHVA